MSHKLLYAALPLFVAACAHRPPAVVVVPVPTAATVPTTGPAAVSAPSSVAAIHADSVAGRDTSTGARPLVAQSGSTTEIVPDSVLRRMRADAVTRQALAVFGTDSAAAPADASGDAEPAWDIDVHSYESTDRVEHYVQLFSGRAREHIEQRLDRGSRYEPMIREEFRKGGLPEDMYYLALIESGFDPNAYSRAAAVGMWQFMTSTARDLGLRVDWWVDERRDPARSTHAAVRFIRGLKEQFGSLYLAAAAYNGGPGRISRGLTRYADDLDGTSGDDLFFALAEKDYLRNETKEYVPQLIAAALVGKDPSTYGLTLHPQPAWTYDSVRVAPATPLAAVAKAADTTLAAIRDLNPQILRGMTPPRDAYTVRVPVGHAAGFDSALAALPKDERTALRKVETKKGDTPDRVAERNGISTRALLAFNPDARRSRKTGRYFPGQVLSIPSAAVVAAMADVPDPAIERYGSRVSTTTHVVRNGETLSGIAHKYHTTVKSLMGLNGLRKAMIFPGQELLVKGGKAKRETAKRETPKRNKAKRGTAKTSKRKSDNATHQAAKSHKAKSGTAKKSGAASAKKAAPSKSAKAKKSASKKPASRG